MTRPRILLALALFGLAAAATAAPINVTIEGGVPTFSDRVAAPEPPAPPRPPLPADATAAAPPQVPAPRAAETTELPRPTGGF